MVKITVIGRTDIKWDTTKMYFARRNEQGLIDLCECRRGDNKGKKLKTNNLKGG